MSSPRRPAPKRPRAERPSDRSRVTRGGLGAGLVAGGEPVQARDGAAQDARDLHLADAVALADLGLGQVALEAQAQDVSLAGGEGAHERPDQHALLGARESVVGVPSVSAMVASSPSSAPAHGASMEFARWACPASI